MTTIIEWNEQIKDKSPFIIGICSRFKLKGSIVNDESISLLTRKVKAPVVFANSPIEIPTQSRGAIVIIERGIISFARKYELAQAAGCSGLIIANNDDVNPMSVFSCVGDIQLSQETILKEGITGSAASIVKGFTLDEKLPCIMISQASYKRLIAENPSTMYMSLLAAEHLKKVQTAELGACIRGTVTFGAEYLLKELLKELLLRHTNDPSGDDSEILQEVLEDVEVDRFATALHISVENQQLACLSMLVRAGADTEAMKNDGYTPLQLAAEIGNSEITTIIADSNSYIDHQHPIGWTALHMACKTGAADVVNILIEAGADINARAADGCSPLHIACLHGSTDCMRVLLEAGCDINLKSSLGALPYEVALYSGHPHAAVIIEEAKSDENYKQVSKLEYFNFRLPTCLRGKKHINLKQPKIYEFEEEVYDEVVDDDDFSEYVIEGKILEEDISVSAETWDGFEGEDSKESTDLKSDGIGALEAITSYLQLGLTPLVSASANVLGGLSRTPSYELQNNSNNTPRNNGLLRTNSGLSSISMKLERQLISTTEETKSEISFGSVSTSSLTEYFTNPVESSTEITDTLAALSDNPDRAQVLANKFIEETLAALSDNPDDVENDTKNGHRHKETKGFSSPKRNQGTSVSYNTPVRHSTHKDVPSPKKTKKLENERTGYTWLINLNKYKSYSMSIEESLFEKESAEIITDIAESIDLMNMDLDRCCFREFTKSRRKVLLRVAAMILITGEVTSILLGDSSDEGLDEWAGKQIRYRQGMLSLLAPIVEAWFESSEGYDDAVNDNDTNAEPLDPSDKRLMRKVLETFHNLLEVFDPLKNYYCHEVAHSTTSPFQQVFDIALHTLRYWAPDVYSCLIWRGMDLTFFAIPWLSTLMADALPLQNVLHLWSKLFEAILVGKSNEMERHISFISSISSNSNNFNSSGILGSLISSVLLQLSQQISPVSTYDDAEVNDNLDRLPVTEELLLLFSSVNNADIENEETRYSIFDEKLICDGIEYLLTNTPKVILNGKSYKNTEDAFLYRHWGHQNDDWGSIWTNLRAAPIFYIHELDLKSIYPCLIIQMDDNITNTLSDDLLRFLGPNRSPNRGKSNEPDTITASMIVDKLKGYLNKNGISNINECKYRELRMKGITKFFRNWALSLSEDLGSHNLSLKSKSSEFGEVKGIARIRMKTNISKGWSGVLSEPPTQIPKVPSTLGRSLKSVGTNSNNVKPVVVIVEYDKDILNDDRKTQSDNIIDAQDVAAVLTICNVSSIIIRSL